MVDASVYFSICNAVSAFHVEHDSIATGGKAVEHVSLLLARDPRLAAVE